MSNIRFKNTAEPTTPPSTTSRVYVDQVDGHLKRKKSDGSVVDYDNAASSESVQDIVGGMLVDSATIDLTYNDPGDTLSADVKPSSLDDTQIIKLSPTKVNDSNYSYNRYTVTTINSTPTLIRQESLVVDGVYLFECRFTGLRLSGAGTNGDSAAFIRTFRVKLVSGNASVSTIQSDYTSRDLNGYNLGISVASNNVNMNVIGINSTNIKWNLDLTITKNF